MALAKLAFASLLLAALFAFSHASDMATPMKKVLILLNDMQQQLQKEGDEDEAVYDKMMCFCETNEKDKTKMIQDAEQRIAELTTLVETTAATSARLNQEIANHEADLAKNQESLGTSTSLREKQAAEFNAEEKDMLQSIQALGAAIVVISKHHQTAFVDRNTAASVANVARAQLQRHGALLRAAITPQQRRMILAFGQQDGKSTFMQANQMPGYQAQSGEIFGILRQMKETFETNLAESQKEEAADKKGYAGLKAAKEEEISATQGALEQKKVQLAEADETNAQSKEDIKDTQASLSIDDKFLLEVKEKCEATRHDWDLRSKARQEEITAIVEAISILSSDAARDNFGKTFATPASFLQTLTSDHRRADAIAVLSTAAARTGNPKLAALAISAQLDAFTKVKAAIDEMISELLKEKSDEILHRDTCTTELHENELSVEREERTKTELESKIEGLENDVAELTSTMETLNADIAELQLQVKRRGEDRELANKDFQGVIGDQRETQHLLQKAISVLKATYARKSAATSLVQTSVAQNPDIPDGFKAYKQSGGGVGVVALLEQILDDAVKMEKAVVSDEQTEQKAYEDFVRTTNQAIATKRKGLVDKGEDKAKAEQDLLQAKDDQRTNIAELEQLTNTAGALHMSCDFIMKNFEVRQESRDEEVEALRQAKAILSGMEADA